MTQVAKQREPAEAVVVEEECAEVGKVGGESVVVELLYAESIVTSYKQLVCKSRKQIS